MNDAVVEDFGRPAINFYVSRGEERTPKITALGEGGENPAERLYAVCSDRMAGVIQRFDSGVIAAQQLGLEPSVVAETLAHYGKEDPFGKCGSMAGMATK